MDHSQATIDILNNPRFQGAIDSITSVTNWVDAGFAAIITFVSFFIISVALLKNVLAGAYTAFPKFWDKVDAAHKETESQGWLQQFKDTFSRSGVEQINMGTLSKALLRLMPNIKTLTDFEDDTISYKQYFIRAIPQMCLVVIIGAFIYNGYYRDVAAKVVDFGSEIFYRVVLEADPIALYDKITNTAGRPNFATGDSVDESDKFAYECSTAAYTTVIGTYTDINTADQKSALAQNLETWVLSCLQENSEYIGQEEWKSKISTTLVLGAPDLTYIHKKMSEDGLTYQVAYAIPISSLGLSTTKEVDKDWYLRMIINFSKQAVEETTVSKLTDITLKLPSSALVKGSDTKIKLPTGTVPDGKGFDYGGNLNSGASVENKTAVLGSDGYLTIKGLSTTGEDIKSFACRIYYVVGGKQHTITSITFGEVSTGHVMSSSKCADFTYTAGPTLTTKKTETDG